MYRASSVRRSYSRSYSALVREIKRFSTWEQPFLTVILDPSIAAELQAQPEPKNEIMEVERRRIKMRSDKNQIRYEVNNSSSYSASYQGPCSLGGRGDSAGVAGKPIRR